MPQREKQDSEFIYMSYISQLLAKSLVNSRYPGFFNHFRTDCLHVYEKLKNLDRVKNTILKPNTSNVCKAEILV